MSASRTLQEAAERLGLTVEALRRQIDQGAFPGRFLSRGAQGVEMRLPLREIEAFERLRSGPASTGALTVRDRWMTAEGQPKSVEPAALSEREGAFQRLFLETVESERAAFYASLRSAWATRDEEMASLRQEVHALRSELREALARVERTVQGGNARVVRPAPRGAMTARGAAVDLDGLFEELRELESIFGVDDAAN